MSPLGTYSMTDEQTGSRKRFLKSVPLRSFGGVWKFVVSGHSSGTLTFYPIRDVFSWPVTAYISVANRKCSECASRSLKSQQMRVLRLPAHGRPIIFLLKKSE